MRALRHAGAIARLSYESLEMVPFVKWTYCYNSLMNLLCPKERTRRGAYENVDVLLSDLTVLVRGYKHVLNFKVFFIFLWNFFQF